MGIRMRVSVVVVACAALVVGACQPAGPVVGSPQLVSIAANGDAPSTGAGIYGLAVSADGRYVVYLTEASDIVANDNNNDMDVFRYDRQTGTTVRVSVSPTGGDDLRPSTPHLLVLNNRPSITGDGRYVVWDSYATNLVPGSSAGLHVYRRDMDTGTTELMDVGTDGQSLGSSQAQISTDGRYLVMAAHGNIASGGDGLDGVYWKDLQTGVAKRAVNDDTGAPITHGPIQWMLSGNGRYVVFNTTATNVVPNFTGTTSYASGYRWDSATGATVPVTVNDTGGKTEGWAKEVSFDGRFVAWDITGMNTTLRNDDHNGRADSWVRDVQAGTNEFVGVGSDGAELGGGSHPTAISADGRYILLAGDNVPQSNENHPDYFLRDRTNHTTTYLTDGGGDINPYGPMSAMSADGKLVAFNSVTAFATNDLNTIEDAYTITIS